MIYGIGIDIVKIERMRAAVDRWGDKFLRRVFTRNEISYCYEKRTPYLSLSVRFAAKEALIKAIGSAASVSLTDIEVTNADTGKPILRMSAKIQDFLASKEIKSAHLSLSHEQDYGVACVILEQ